MDCISGRSGTVYQGLSRTVHQGLSGTVYQGLSGTVHQGRSGTVYQGLSGTVYHHLHLSFQQCKWSTRIELDASSRSIIYGRLSVEHCV